MNKVIKILVIVLILVLIAVGVKYLMPQKEKSFLEKTGSAIDRGIDKLGDKLDGEGAVEKAGKKIDKAIDGLGDKLKDMSN